MNATVDVIIPVYAPKGEFECSLEMLRHQTVRPNRIIVINTDEGLFDRVKYASFSEIEVYHIEKREFDHGGTRQMAAEKSSADYMMYMTMDAVPGDERLIERLLDQFADERVAVAYAKQVPRSDCSEIEQYSRQFNYPDYDMLKTTADVERLGIKAFFTSNVAAMYRKSSHLELGGFERRTICSEDMEYACRAVKAGYSVAYAAKAHVVHSHNYTCFQQLTRNFDVGVFMAEHPHITEGVKAEKEGSKLVWQTAKHLVEIGKPLMVAYLVVNSAYKLIGYKLGQVHKYLPMWLIRRISMNKGYWKE